MTFGSLFTGIGGFDLGFERAGMKCVWQVEKHLGCHSVLVRHWPDTPRYKDVREFPAGDVIRPDGICGGFPCTQTSVAAAIHGKRSGLDGKDSGLWYEMLRIVRELCPEWVVVENTGGAATWAAEIEDGLASAGYAVQRLDLSAWDSGAPHVRRRVFWLAHRDRSRLAITWQRITCPTALGAWRAANRNAWLSSLAGVRRVDDGVPDGVDRRQRIEQCGNAVVPAVAEWIGRQIVDAGGEFNREKT